MVEIGSPRTRRIFWPGKWQTGFDSIKEVEGKELHLFVKKFGAAKSVHAGFLLALEFAKKYFTGVGNALTAGSQRGEVTVQRKSTKYPLAAKAAAQPWGINRTPGPA